jgi:hypothetical protein
MAWAKLASTPDHNGIVATQTGTHKPSFDLYYSVTYGWAFDSYDSDSDAAQDFVASQNAQNGGPSPQPGEWTQLIGSYDANTDDMRLYVNGHLAGATKFSTPFYGGGPTQIGAGNYDGAVRSHFPGQIDKVQLYDRALSGPEAEEMYNNQLLVEGRWTMDTGSGSPLVSPDSLPAEADRHPLTLGSGAQIDASGWNNRVGTGGLVLDGTAGGYASTSVSPIHTDKSFTISAWVLLPSAPTVPVTVMSMAGQNTSSLAVQYDPATSSWQLRVAASDSSPPAQSVVSNTNVTQGDWNHLVVVYDLPAGTISLYANGEIVPSGCGDDGDTGSDGPDCTVPWVTDAAPFDAAMGLQLGRDKTSASTWGDYMSGDIDDVWVFAGIASDAQIKSLASGWDLDTTAGP